MILYETLAQPYFLLMLISLGFVCGTIFDFGEFIAFLCQNNKIIRNIIDFLSILISFFIFLYFTQKYSYGELRFFAPLFFYLFLIIERITIGKLVAKIYLWCYTIFRKFGKYITKTREKFNGKNKQKN